MDEVSSYVRLPYRRLTARPWYGLFHLVFEIPWWKGLCADSEEKREPASDIDTVPADSLKRLTLIGRLEKRTCRERRERVDPTRMTRLGHRPSPQGQMLEPFASPECYSLADTMP